MSKRQLLLLATALGLVALQACSSDESNPYTPGTAGSAGHAAGAAGHAGSAGHAGTVPVAGATNEAGQAGEGTGDSGAPGTAGSSEAGTANGGHAGASTGGTAGVGGTLPSGGAAGVGDSHAGSGGSTAGTGGSTAGSGGSTAGSGGSTAGSGGSTAGTGGSTAGSGGASTTFTLQPTTLGQVISTQNGLSLYVFNTDTPGAGATLPVSTCNGACLSTWPIYYGNPVSVPSGLLAADFGSFDHGGVMQSTYKGWPLYRYAPDTAVGDVKGEGFNNKWYTAKLPFVFPSGTTFSLQNTTLGKVIATANGLSLYVFKNDTPAVGATPPVSACGSGCLGTWPIYYANAVTVPSGLQASDFGSFDRGSGVMQSTYKGWPLYRYAPDTSIAEVKGEALGALWYTAKSPFVAP